MIDALAHYASLNDLSSDVFYRLGHRNDSVPSSSSKRDIVNIGTHTLHSHRTFLMFITQSLLLFRIRLSTYPSSYTISFQYFYTPLLFLAPFLSALSLLSFFILTLYSSSPLPLPLFFKDENLTEEEKGHDVQASQMRGVAVTMWALAGTAYYDLALEKDEQKAKKGKEKEKGKLKGVKDDDLSSSSSYFYESASACYQKALRWGVWGALPPVAGRTPPRSPELGSECRVLLW